MPSAVRTDRLTKDFTTGFWRPRPHRGLDGLTCDIPLGGVFGLLGPNGAGKSTTLKLLLHLLRPSSGTAEVLGHPPGDVRAHQRVGFLPENPTFYDYLTAEELLTYFAGLFGYSKADCAARAAKTLDRVGLAGDRRRPLRQYSKGMVQRVGIAQALINDPELVIFDEPMSGLDPLGRRDVRALILRLRDRGCTVFFSSHVLSDAEALCSRVAILAKGRLIASGQLSDMVAFHARGWELVVAGMSDAAAAAIAPRVRRITKIGDGRYELTLPLDPAPDRIMTELVAAGAHVVSLNPIRETLEDFFVQQVTSPDTLAVRRGLEDAR